MIPCVELADIEALVVGELDATHARRLREHAQSCGACRGEIDLVTAERTLFARRAAVVGAPPPALASAVLRRIDAERSPVRRLLAPALGFVRRGHVSAACAAALFVVAAFSRSGAPAMPTSGAISADEETNASGMLASYGRVDEPAACSLGSVLSASYDDGAAARASSNAASRGEVLACRASADGARSPLPCEPFVTCSWLRQ